MTNSNPFTFYFHDYETFGKHPGRDRPAQFAGVRTDAHFNIVEEPLVIYCQPADDYLPDPEAVMITGITPQLALARGVKETEFAGAIHQAFSQPNTCILGYNNIRFDDEVTRHLFYRNFLDPYAYSWQQGNSRWDLLDLMRTCYALRPEGIEWPLNDEDLPSFKLEHLTQANGVEHSHAHDAMSDVYATIAMAKKVKESQPRLFEYLFQLRNKQKVSALIDIVNMTPLLHVSGMFGRYRNNISIVAPLAWHPDNKNAVIMCDLTGDLSPLLTLNAEELRERLYTKHSDLPIGESPIPLKLVHINKCPVLAPLKTLLADNAQRLNLAPDACLEKQRELLRHPEIREKVVALFAESPAFAASQDVDLQLYEGFFGEADRASMQILRQTLPKNLPALELKFSDKRLSELFFRYRARNYPETLNEQEQRRWHLHRQSKLTPEALETYLLTLNDLAGRFEDQSDKVTLLRALFEYGRQLTQ